MKRKVATKASSSGGRVRKERTRNGGTETEAQHFGKIRSALRGLTRFSWQPKKDCLKAASQVVYNGKRKQVVYTCAICWGKYTVKDVQVDHIIPVGSLNSYTDLPAFCQRLFVEDPALLRVLCEKCHQEVTNKTRAEKKL